MIKDKKCPFCNSQEISRNRDYEGQKIYGCGTQYHTIRDYYQSKECKEVITPISTSNYNDTIGGNRMEKDPSKRDIEIANEIFECTQADNITPDIIHATLDHWEVAVVIKEYREEIERELK
jgi:hypothetical protein